MSLFAIVPAAGLSRRMGQPKLVMDLAGKSVIERLLFALSHPAVTETVVVFRKSDAELADAISALSLPNVRSVQPNTDPPDMKNSVERAVESVRSRHTPQPADGWMLIPADHPVLSPQILDELITAWRTTTEDILIPQHGGKNGHPTFFRWTIADRLAEIPDDKGLNWLRTTAGISIRKLAVDSESILLDLDTPDDYQRILQQANQSDRATPEA